MLKFSFDAVCEHTGICLNFQIVSCGPVCELVCAHVNAHLQVCNECACTKHLEKCMCAVNRRKFLKIINL